MKRSTRRRKKNFWMIFVFSFVTSICATKGWKGWWKKFYFFVKVEKKEKKAFIKIDCGKIIMKQKGKKNEAEIKESENNNYHKIYLKVKHFILIIFIFIREILCISFFSSYFFIIVYCLVLNWNKFWIQFGCHLWVNHLFGRKFLGWWGEYTMQLNLHNFLYTSIECKINRLSGLAGESTVSSIWVRKINYRMVDTEQRFNGVIPSFYSSWKNVQG